MQDIKIDITGKRAKTLGSPELVCNNEYDVRFAFDAEWDGLEAKTARLVYDRDGEVKKQDIPFVGDTVKLPKLSRVREVRVGIYAGDLITTTPARLRFKPSILCSEGVPEEPTEDVYNQIMALFNEKVLSNGVPVDQDYNPESEHPQSGKAVAQALEGHAGGGPIRTDDIADNAVTIDKVAENFFWANISGSSGGDVEIMTLKTPPLKPIILLAKLRNKATEITEASTDDEIPTAKAVRDEVQEQLQKFEPGVGQVVEPGAVLASGPKYKPLTTIVNDCQNTADWSTLNLSNCEADKTNYIIGSQSIHSNTGAMICAKNTYDMLNNYIVLKLRINSIAVGAHLYMQVLNTNNPSKSVVYELMRGASTTPTGDWREITVPYTGYSYGSFEDVDFSDINYLRLYADNGEVDWNLQLVGTRPLTLDKGVVTFTFDDGYKSQIKGFQMLAARGATGTLFYIPEADTNGSDDYLKIADLQNLVNYYNADIGVHGATSYNTKTDEELLAHWENTQKLFKDNGLGEGRHMSYPNNYHEDRVVQLSRRYFDSCRTISYYIPAETYPPADTHRLRAISSIGAAANDVNYIKDKIDRAMASKSWLILTFHRIEDGDTSMHCSESDFAAIVDYAIESGAYIMNMAEVMNSAVINTGIGNISEALDCIIDIQNGLIGGAES